MHQFKCPFHISWFLKSSHDHWVQLRVLKREHSLSLSCIYTLNMLKECINLFTLSYLILILFIPWNIISFLLLKNQLFARACAHTHNFSSYICRINDCKFNMVCMSQGTIHFGLKQSQIFVCQQYTIAV